MNGVKTIIEELKKSYEPKKPEEYLTRDEVVTLLKINLSTLWSWTKKGKLTSYGIKGEGNRIYYKRSEIESALVKLKHKR
ncbi:MAG: helix-turn-helix domain-containing protein [Flavobacteriia bacterium]|nr:helix-turn-helix domain-containing protein [Flavobacteriia bacterium]